MKRIRNYSRNKCNTYGLYKRRGLITLHKSNMGRHWVREFTQKKIKFSKSFHDRNKATQFKRTEIINFKIRPIVTVVIFVYTPLTIIFSNSVELNCVKL